MLRNECGRRSFGVCFNYFKGRIAASMDHVGLRLDKKKREKKMKMWYSVKYGNEHQA